MEVTNIRVSFMREKQPVQYEKAQPMVELAGTLEDGENHLTAARNLMMDAATIVYAGIGYSVPAKVADALMNIAAVSQQVKAAKATVNQIKVEKGSAKDEKPAAKKPRGRPKGSANKKTSEAEVQKIITDANAASEVEKAQTAKEPQDLELAAAAAANDPIPGDEIPGDNISTGGDRIDPDEKAAGSIGMDDDPEDFTPKDLHDLIIGHVKASPRTLSMDNARAILAHFKVARAQDLTNVQAIEGKVMLDQMVAEEAA